VSAIKGLVQGSEVTGSEVQGLAEKLTIRVSFDQPLLTLDKWGEWDAGAQKPPFDKRKISLVLLLLGLLLAGLGM
jgi:hypothetical protein